MWNEKSKFPYFGNKFQKNDNKAQIIQRNKVVSYSKNKNKI